MALDFSKLDSLAYRGFNGSEARAEKDKLTEQGYTIIEGIETPFSAPLPTEQNIQPPAHTAPLKGNIAAFTGMDASRDYKKMYRAAHDFHKEHNPPTVNLEYWRTHKPGQDTPPDEELSYWIKAAEDVGKTAASFNNDPFLTGLLTAVFDELEREYKARRDEASSAA